MDKTREVVDLLIKEGLITDENLQKAREESKRTGLPVDKALEKLGFISDKEILRVRASTLSLPYIDLADYMIDKSLIPLIPEQVAKKYKAVPLFRINNSLTVGMVDPQDVAALDHIRRVSHMDMIEPVLISEKGVQLVLDTCYTAEETFEDIVRSIDKEKIQESDRKGLVEVAEDAPVIKLVNNIISQAIKDRASDIHMEPEEDSVRIRIRIDGLLNEMAVFPKKLQNALVSRVKVLAKMDIAESRKPQDGRIRLKMENKDLDMRISTFPTVHGENVVMRLLDKSSVVMGLKELGLLEEDLQMFNKLIRRPHGIILVTGPTGSGKTTTLYTALSTISSMEKNIVTIEDPVEYELPLIRQTQVNTKAGITFANGLRSLLRQDPDVMMVGEIRDKETAEVAIQASLTGHLVFATLHTNDAPSSLTRLIDMEIESFLISSSIVGIIAQRLVRLICDKCKERYEPTAEVIKELGITEKMEFSHGKGCHHCKKTGFIGRSGIFEILTLNDEIRRMIDQRSSADDIKKKAITLGMKTLRKDGLIKVQKGITVPEEVLRVTEIE